MSSLLVGPQQSNGKWPEEAQERAATEPLNLPRHWTIKPLKHVAQINPDALDDTTDPNFELEYVDIGNVDSLGKITDTQLLIFKDAPSRARRLVTDGDTIISTVRTYLKAIAFVEKPPKSLIVSTGFAVLRPTEIVLPKYLWYVTQSNDFVQRVVAHSDGVSYPAIPPTELGTLKVWIPPIPEQKRIIGFLERETARIDTVVAQKERLIALLEEKKVAVVNRAVTEGLNPSVASNTSHIPWFSKVPAHWSHHKLGYLVRMVSGGTPDKANAEYWRGTIPWVSPKDMKSRAIADSEDHVSALAVEETGLKIIDAPAVLIVVRGMILAHTFPVGLTEKPVTINQDMKALTDFHLCSGEFLAHLLAGLASVMLAHVEEAAHGTKCLRTDQWEGIEVFLPGKDEQDKICEWIADAIANIDLTAAKIDRQIRKLREYRAALISLAVTGRCPTERGN